MTDLAFLNQLETLTGTAVPDDVRTELDRLTVVIEEIGSLEDQSGEVALAMAHATEECTWAHGTCRPQPGSTLLQTSPSLIACSCVEDAYCSRPGSLLALLALTAYDLADVRDLTADAPSLSLSGFVAEIDRLRSREVRVPDEAPSYIGELRALVESRLIQLWNQYATADAITLSAAIALVAEQAVSDGLLIADVRSAFPSAAPEGSDAAVARSTVFNAWARRREHTDDPDDLLATMRAAIAETVPGPASLDQLPDRPRTPLADATTLQDWLHEEWLAHHLDVLAGLRDQWETRLAAILADIPAGDVLAVASENAISANCLGPLVRAVGTNALGRTGAPLQVLLVPSLLWSAFDRGFLNPDTEQRWSAPNVDDTETILLAARLLDDDELDCCSDLPSALATARSIREPAGLAPALS